jgi:transposase
VARIPVLRCENCKAYPQVTVPWARPKVGYTVELEREIFMNLDDRSILSTAEYLDIGDWVVGDVVEYRVGEALKKLDLSRVDMVFIDETSFKKGHHYITVVCDQDKRIIFMCEGKDSGTVDLFRIWLEEHRGKADNITVVSCDMGQAYGRGEQGHSQGEIRHLQASGRLQRQAEEYVRLDHRVIS